MPKPDHCSPEKVEELRRRLASPGRDSSLEPYRFADGSETAWDGSPAGSTRSLKRFLTARKGNVELADAMFASHLAWRGRTFPIPREGAVAEILADGRRFRKIGHGEGGLPVLMVHFCWGYFLEGVTALDCLAAAMIYIDTEIEAAERAGVSQACVLSYGGPPPLAFAGSLSAMLEANYPERLLRAVIYPVPRPVAMFVRMMLWFVDKDTRAKVNIMWSEDDAVRCLGLSSASQLPEEIQGGLPAAERHFQPDSPARMNQLLRDGIYGGKAGVTELQRQFALLSPQAKIGARTEHSESSIWCCCTNRPRDVCGGKDYGGHGHGATGGIQQLSQQQQQQQQLNSSARAGKASQKGRGPFFAMSVVLLCLILLCSAMGLLGSPFSGSLPK